VNCLTCHQGQTKPLGGQAMIDQYPYLRPAAAGQQPQQQPNAVERALDQPGSMTTRITPPNAPPTNQQPPVTK
jgi:photosynthetic reaction center cytochrome c subunit